MSALSSAVVLTLAASFAAADTDAKVSFAKGYPRPGDKAGQVVVRGEARPSTGYKLVSAVAHVFPPGGGKGEIVDVTVGQDGGLGPVTVSGLAPGETYTVRLIVTESLNGKDRMQTHGALPTVKAASGEEWAEGYPKPGAKAGEIIIRGVVRPRDDFKVVSTTARVWPKAGGQAKDVDVPLAADGGFGPITISGLNSGGEYNVLVMITEAKDGKEQMRAPPLVVVKAP